jgi:hypothetical protein
MSPDEPNIKKNSNAPFMRMDNGCVCSKVINPDEIQVLVPIFGASILDQTPNSQTTVTGSSRFF